MKQKDKEQLPDMAFIPVDNTIIPESEFEKRYHVLFSYSPVPIIIHDGKDIIDVNDAALKVLRIDNLDILKSRNLFDFVHPDDREESARRMQKMQQTGEKLPPMRLRIHFPGMDEVITIATPTPITWSGKPAFMISYVDITHQEISKKIREIQLELMHYADGHSTEEYMQRFLDQLCMLCGCEFSFFYLPKPDELDCAINICASSRLKELWETEKIGMDYPLSIRKEIEHCLIHQTPLKTQNSNSHDQEDSSQTKILRELLIPVKRGNKVEAIVALVNKAFDFSERDISNVSLLADAAWETIMKNSAQQAVKESEELYRKAFETSPDSININRLSDGMYVSVNEGFSKVTGYTKEETLGRSSMEINIWDDNNDRNRLVQMLSEYGYVENMEAKFRMKNGQVKEGIMSANIIMIKGERHILSITRDISRIKKAEKKLKLALTKAEESDRLKSAFLANMSHEIRTPMNGILGFSNLLRKEGLSSSEMNNYIDIIHKSGQRMLNTINDIIDISKIESNQIEVRLSEFKLNQRLEYHLNTFTPDINNAGLEIRFKPGFQKELIVLSDMEKIDIILSNLVRNAIKFTKSGYVEFGYSLNRDRNEIINDFEFYVEDSGIGIQEEYHKSIFNRFFQADHTSSRLYEGSGLGLSITKAYVEALSGQIRVESSPGEGSRFIFNIPMEITSEIAVQKSEDIKVRKKPDAFEILIAEDDEASVFYLKELLHNFDVKISVARNGQEAVDIISRNKDIHLVLMDIKMPVMNGLVASRKIREINKEVVIIAQTAFALQGDHEKVIRAGCNDYITKPVNKDSFASLIKKYFPKK